MTTILDFNDASVFEHKKNKVSDIINKLLVKPIELASKTLKLQKVSKGSDSRKLVISTDWFPLFNFNIGDLVEEVVLGENQGFVANRVFAMVAGAKKMYYRRYKNRGNKLEPQMDIRHQSNLNKSLGNVDYAHITFTMNQITVKPVQARNVLAKTLDVDLCTESGTYHGVIDIVERLRKEQFEAVTIRADEAFIDSHECVLLSMQLRRLGYKVQTENGQLKASITGKFPDIRHPWAVNDDIQMSFDAGVNFSADSPLSTFVACTAGVDCHALESDGFEVKSILETRPIEERDVTKKTVKQTGDTIEVITDKTETGAMCAALNSNHVKHVFNEDVFLFNSARFSQQLSGHNFLHASLLCPEFSPLKTKKAKLDAIKKLSSTRDMFVPILQIIREINVPTLLIENVPDFKKSKECEMFIHRLKSLGYATYQSVLSGVKFNGGTKRSRCYIFATKLTSAFDWPLPLKRTVHAWDDVIAPRLSELREVTHTKSVQKGLTTGRIRLIKVGDEVAPTIFKAQKRQVKDSVYVYMNNKYYMPSVGMLRELMGIPASFDLSDFPLELQTEIIGQSVEVKMHKAITQKVKAHIADFTQSLVKLHKYAFPYSF